MSLDLSGARAAAEAFLVDTCTVYRDPEGTADDTIDPDTLELVPPDPDEIEVYSGRCLVGDLGNDAAQRAGMVLAEGQRRVRLPHDAAVPELGDRLVVTASANNPHLVGQSFRVVVVVDQSLYVTRQLVVERTTVVPV